MASWICYGPPADLQNWMQTRVDSIAMCFVWIIVQHLCLISYVYLSNQACPHMHVLCSGAAAKYDYCEYEA